MTPANGEPFRPAAAEPLSRTCVAIVLLLTVYLTGGCAEKSIPQARIAHYLRSTKSVLGLGRVVFVALDDRKCPQRIAAGMSDALAGAIQRRKLFHIDTLAASDAACKDLPFRSREAYSMKELAEIRDALRCDAVMFGSVTHFQTYPRMQIGIYVRLLDLKNGKLIWAVDHTWDSTDSQTEARIKDFFGSQMRSGYDPAQWRLGLMSPKVFQKFIAFEAANTLPSREGAEQLRRARRRGGSLLGMLKSAGRRRLQGILTKRSSC